MPKSIKNQGDAIVDRYRYEDVHADGGGGGGVDVDNDIFDSVGLPELPVDHDHATMAEAASMAAAAIARHHEASLQAGVPNEYDAAAVAGMSHAPEDVFPVAAAAIDYHHPIIPRPPMPMAEAIIPPKWLSRYVSFFRHAPALCQISPESRHFICMGV